jgi:ferrous iron transport protein B
MSASVDQRVITVALLGNPNTGKSTLFSALAGVRQRTGNYPGVTVEKKIGHLKVDGRRLALIDLPGTYSVAPRSPDEMVAIDVLLGRRDDVPPPDVVLCIVDASNLERNLYLVSQVLSIGRPTVVALNMIDIARKRGLAIDAKQLGRRLGVPVVEVQANQGHGIEPLTRALLATLEQATPPGAVSFPAPFEEEVSKLAGVAMDRSGKPLPRFLLERLLLDTSGYLQHEVHSNQNGVLRETLTAAQGRLAAAGYAVPAVEAVTRYQWIAEKLDGVVSRPAQRAATRSDALDRLLTHRWSGTLICDVFVDLRCGRGADGMDRRRLFGHRGMDRIVHARGSAALAFG